MSKVKRYFLILPILCIVLVPCTSVFVSASNFSTFEFQIPEPAVDEYNGYVVIPYYNPTINGVFCDLYFWHITPVNTPDNNSVPSVTLSYNSSSFDFTLSFGTGQSDCSWTVQLFKTQPYGYSASTQTIFSEGFEVISYSDAPSFTLNYGNVDFYSPVFLGCNFSAYNSSDYIYSTDYYNIVWGDDRALYEELLDVSDKISDLINGLDLTNEQLTDLYTLLNDYLSKINKNTNSLVSLLDQFYYEWYQWTWTEQEFYDRIIELLEQLIEGTEEFTESSTLSDEQNELNRVEDELLNNEAASDAQEDIKVEVNENALSFIWDFISRFFNANPKLMGLVVSILSLGIIALILNR